MRLGEAVTHRLAGSTGRALESKRRENQILEPIVNDFAGNHLDHASSKIESRVVVTPHRSRRRELRHVAHSLGVVIHRVDATILGRDLAFPARSVGQQIQDADFAARGLILDLEIREVLPNRRLQFDFTLVDQPHHRGSAKSFRNGCNRENGLGCHRLRILHVRHSEASHGRFAILHQSERNAGDVILDHLRLDELCELFKAIVGLWEGNRLRTDCGQRRDT